MQGAAHVEYEAAATLVGTPGRATVSVVEDAHFNKTRLPAPVSPSAATEELKRGDRVEGLGNLGSPTGEIGTVERTNEDDAVVKWDDDGRVRVGQPWLKKI